MAQSWDDLYTMVGHVREPAREARSIILCTMVSDHVNPAFENPNCYLRIHLHTFFCVSIISHCMEVRDKLKSVVLASFLEHIMIDVSYVSHRHNGQWHVASPTTRHVVTHESERALQDMTDN